MKKKDKFPQLKNPTKEWPPRMPKDHKHVKMLLDEAERLTKLAQKWDQQEHSNPMAVNNCYTLALKMATAAAWLRCALKGEFKEMEK